jgi:hypothetical protein
MDSRYQIVSLGAKVKETARDLFGMTEKDRALLIAIGTKMREIDPDVWVKSIVTKTASMTHCVVDDLRYQNEYELLRENGFVFVQLHVSHHMQEQRIRKVYPKDFQDHLDNRNHLSERNTFQWDDPDSIIHIDNAEDHSVIYQRVYSFLQKDENNA